MGFSVKEAVVFKLTNEGFFIIFNELIRFDEIKYQMQKSWAKNNNQNDR